MVFEFEPISGASRRKFNYTSGDIFASDITMPENGTVLIRFKANASGVLTMTEDLGGDEDSGTVFDGDALTSGAWQTTEQIVKAGERWNFSYSVAATELSLEVLTRRG